MAFAVDFSTPGEKLTRRAVDETGHGYIPVQLMLDDIREWSAAHRAAKDIYDRLGPFQYDHFRLNIAGNSLTSFPADINQKDLDIFMTRTLMLLHDMTGRSIRSVRSGGQTGIDEAGVKAADTLGITAVVNGPADYRFRIRNGGGYMDISDKTRFIDRFSSDHKHRIHLEPLGELESQIRVFPADMRKVLLEGGTCLFKGMEIEIAENSKGQDRLWAGDELFSDYVKENEGKEKDYSIQSAYAIYKARVCEYMADSSKQVHVIAESMEEAERKLKEEFVTRLVGGDYEPDVYDLTVKSLVINGNGYELTAKDLEFIDDEKVLMSRLISREPDFINVFYGTGEHAELSNFAIRPFDFLISEDSHQHFQSVEQGFQFMKTLPQYNDLSDEVRFAFQRRILGTTDGGELKKIGHEISPFHARDWNRVSNKIMKDMIMASFDPLVNPEAHKRLLETSGKQITHLHDKSFWNHGFPVNLMTVRDEYARRQAVKEEYSRLTVKTTEGSLRFYEGDIKPEKGVVFVFGSNTEGRHGLGSAKIAREHFGAIYGQAEGLQGNSYGIPTKNLQVKANKGYRSVSKAQIIQSIARMYECARENFDKTFMVAYRNAPGSMTLSGYSGREMISMFLKAGTPPYNVQFSMEWKQEMERLLKTQGFLKKSGIL